MITRLAAIGTAVLALGLASCGSEKPTEPTPHQSSSAVTDRLDLAGLKEGTAPRIDWSVGTQLNGTKEVLGSTTDQFARTKQLLVIRDVDGNVYAYAPEGPTNKTPIGQATGNLAINAERNLVAWIAPDGSPTVLQEGEARPAVLEKPAGVTAGDAVAVLGHDCFNGPETVEGAGCSVYFRSTDTGEPQSYVASNHGFVERMTGGKGGLSLQDADESGDVGWTTLNRDQTTCSTYTGRETLDADTAKGWTTCDFMPLAFSPDGRHVLASGPRGFEGSGISAFAVLDRMRGKPVLDVPYNSASEATITDLAWEDSEHVLAVINQKFEWAIVRLGLDGSLELASKPFTYRNDQAPDRIQLHLAVQP